MPTSRQRAKQPGAAQATQPKSTSISAFRWIDTDLIDDPLNPARETFDEERLNDLIQSIRQIGIMVPLIVHPEGDRFRVDAGHRRIVSARAVGLKQVPCRVYSAAGELGEAIKHHENRFREDLNAAEEARHFKNLLDDACDGDVDKLCALVKERRQYVEDRLLLSMGDPRVFQALADSTISIGVAKELNMIKDPSRRMMYLESAMQGGASVRMVRDWRIRGNADDEFSAGTVNTDNPKIFTPAAEPLSTSPECLLCHSRKDQHEMEVVFMHRSCVRANERMAETAARERSQTEGL